MPQTYTCVAGDTYESIASNLYGDATLASYIDAANGGGVLIAGQTLVVPQLISVHNKAGMARPYYQLLQIIQGSLTPHLNTPQPPPPHHHDGFFGFLVKAIVIAVVCVAVPELAPGLIPGIAGALGVSEVIVTAVGVGLVDAAAQGLCIGLGIQDRFSMAELATTIITAGFGGQLGPLSAEFTTAELMEYIVQAGLVNVEEQLAEMALGIRHQFDLAGVALAMGSAGLSSEIKIANPLERSIVADLGVAAIGGVVRGRIDVENLAIQLISDSARYAVQQSYANSSVSDEYHQSQKASRGEGHITQTTVDQQWESHLINDAEFTANTPLPSITLDYNNAQLGQRVGEEVSHFYHPTPPPARNPSGFWQRVGQRYKNSFERQALIAEGRASAYSEVMRESVGHAAANQQNYLDLGYTDSVAQYGAAELAAATELPFMIPEVGIPVMTGAATIELPFMIPETGVAIKLGNGLLQVSKIANRWGFFGHNEREIIETGAYSNLVNSTAKDLGKLANKEVRISQKGLNLIKQHLSQFGPVKENGLMLQRLEQSLKSRQLLTNADASFYIHEATEATKMSRGMSYMKAHQFALDKYQVSPFSVYHPDVINEVNALEPGSFNNKWLDFWDEYLSNSSNPTLKK